MQRVKEEYEAYLEVTPDNPPAEGSELKISQSEANYGAPYWTNPETGKFWMFARLEDRTRAYEKYNNASRSKSTSSNQEKIKYRTISKDSVRPAFKPQYQKFKINEQKVLGTSWKAL